MMVPPPKRRPKAAIELACPICNAKPGQACGLYLPPERRTHFAREFAAKKEAEAS